VSLDATCGVTKSCCRCCRGHGIAVAAHASAMGCLRSWSAAAQRLSFSLAAKQPAASRRRPGQSRAPQVHAFATHLPCQLRAQLCLTCCCTALEHYISESLKSVPNTNIYCCCVHCYRCRAQRCPNCMLPLMFPAWILSLLLQKVMFCVPGVVY
jgi:hypothetical protein